MNSRLLNLLLLVFISSGAFTQLPFIAPEKQGFSPERLQRIDNNINQWIAEGNLNGAVALIVHQGKVVYHKSFGYDDAAKTKAIPKDAIYRIASQTKAITSVGVMMLYEEGKFLLDDPIGKYLPEFNNLRVLDQFNPADSSYTSVPAKSAVTIRQLLTHTSGIGYAQIGSKESNAIYGKAGITAGFGVANGHLLANDMKLLARMPLMHQPGEKYTYGLNTDLLGYFIEVVSGQKLDQFFQKRIFEPLGMKDTYFFLPENKKARLVDIYVEKDRKLSPAPAVIESNGPFIKDYPKLPGTYLSGGAGLSSTAMDYAVFLQMLLNGGSYNGKRILSRNSVRMMTMNQIGDLNNGINKFGLGFGITTERGSSILPTPEGVFEWGGAYSTTYWADPKEQLVGIIFRQLWRTTQGDQANKYKVLVYQALE